MSYEDIHTQTTHDKCMRACESNRVCVHVYLGATAREKYRVQICMHTKEWKEKDSWNDLFLYFVCVCICVKVLRCRQKSCTTILFTRLLCVLYAFTLLACLQAIARLGCLPTNIQNPLRMRDVAGRMCSHKELLKLKYFMQTKSTCMYARHNVQV